MAESGHGEKHNGEEAPGLSGRTSSTSSLQRRSTMHTIYLPSSTAARPFFYVHGEARMSKPYDATFKHLFEEYPQDWLRLAGFSVQAAVEVVDAELSTVTAAADKLLRVNETVPWLVHLEPQSSYEVGLPGRVHTYNTLAHQRHGLLVRSVVLLLRKEAGGRAINGLYRLKFPNEKQPYLEFRYRVLKVWELPVAAVVAGGLGTLPLALLSDDATSRMEDVVHQVQQRVVHEAEKPEADVLLSAAYVLTGLRYSRAVANTLFQGVRSMRESDTYQAILEEGRAEGLVLGRAEGRTEGRTEALRNLLLRLGTRRFGPPGEAIVKQLRDIQDSRQLEQLAERLLEVASWAELFSSSNGEPA
jgi:predicted transposase YdaD